MSRVELRWAWSRLDLSMGLQSHTQLALGRTLLKQIRRSASEWSLCAPGGSRRELRVR